MELKGKTAFVTGGAKRIGRSIALALAGCGCDVAIGYLSSKNEAENTVKDLCALGVRAMAVQGDLSKSSQVNLVADHIESKLGPVDILINNASLFKRTPWPEISESDWDELLDINTKAPFLCAQRFSKHMIEHKQGKIINILDWMAERPSSNYIPHCVSKAALTSLTQALAIALAPFVQVNGIHPGTMLFAESTNEKEKALILEKIPLQQIGTPQDVANAVLFLLEGTDYATGTILRLDGGRLLI